MSTEEQRPAEAGNAQAPEMPASAPPRQSPPQWHPYPPQKRGSGLGSLVLALVAMLIGVVIGAAGVGENILRYLSPAASQSRELSELSARMDELRRDLTAREKELSAERQERKQAVATLKQSVETAEWNTLAANYKADFQSRVLAYERGRSDATRRQLVEAACGLKAQGTPARMMLVMAPLDVTGEEFRRGTRPEIDQLLLQANVPVELIARVRRDPARVVIPQVTPFNVAEVQRAAQVRRLAMRDVQEAIETIQRRAQSIRIARAVRFADGEEHVLPVDVSLAMALRKDCSGG